MFRVIMVLPCLFLLAASFSSAQEAQNNAQPANAAEEASLSQSAGAGERLPANTPVASRKGSIMFRADELENIYASLSQAVVSSSKDSASVPVATPYEGNYPSDKPLVAPAFYVSSILYYSHGNWAVWINGKRIRNGEEGEGFHVEKITGDYVDITASKLYLDRISPNWRDKLLKIQVHEAATEGKAASALQDAWDYMSADKKILVNSANGMVKFRLGLHQTFVSHSMEIVEGFRKETVLVQGTGAGAAAPAPADGKIPARGGGGDVFDSL